MSEINVIQSKIYEIRGMRVMLDFDLAELYQVETRVLNQSVKRNIKRFPPDFMFQLNVEEFSLLKSQFVTSRWGGTRKLQLNNSRLNWNCLKPNLNFWSVMKRKTLRQSMTCLKMCAKKSTVYIRRLLPFLSGHRNHLVPRSDSNECVYDKKH